LTISVVSVGGAGCNGTRRLEKEDASAQGVLVISTPITTPGIKELEDNLIKI
jgi:cell division GTPase FtsZ